MISFYHGGKITRSQQSFLTETTICIVKGWKKSMGYHFVPKYNHEQESQTCQIFGLIILPYLQDLGFCYPGEHDVTTSPLYEMNISYIE